jgi:hypothetical protein
MEVANYQKNNEVKITELFEMVFKKQISNEFWQWRFVNNPVKETQIILIWDKEELVSHYAVCPLKFLIEGKECKAALSMTTMTHPYHNGKGYFKKSAFALYEKLEQENFALVYGFPNSNSHYAFVNSLGWKDVERIPMLSINNFSLLKSATTEFKKIESFSHNHYQTFLFHTKEYALKLKRDEQFLNWRYKENPTNNYDCFESENVFFVTKKYSLNNSTAIDLCELYCDADAEKINEIVSFILMFYKNENVSQINFWLPLHDAKHLLLEKIGFKLTAPITFIGFRNSSKIDFSKYNTNDWFYSFGDSDIF